MSKSRQSLADLAQLSNTLATTLGDLNCNPDCFLHQQCQPIKCLANQTQNLWALPEKSCISMQTATAEAGRVPKGPRSACSVPQLANQILRNLHSSSQNASTVHTNLSNAYQTYLARLVPFFTGARNCHKGLGPTNTSKAIKILVNSCYHCSESETIKMTDGNCYQPLGPWDDLTVYVCGLQPACISLRSLCLIWVST